MTDQSDRRIRQRYEDQTMSPTTQEIARLTHALSEAQQREIEKDAEIARLMKEVNLLVHKVITCGVAASHPNANLTREKKCYAETWDSPQAESVRQLRSAKDTAASALTTLQMAVREWKEAEESFWRDEPDEDVPAKTKRLSESANKLRALVPAAADEETTT
jgi:hypothetical protein